MCNGRLWHPVILKRTLQDRKGAAPGVDGCIDDRKELGVCGETQTPISMRSLSDLSESGHKSLNEVRKSPVHPVRCSPSDTRACSPADTCLCIGPGCPSFGRSRRFHFDSLKCWSDCCCGATGNRSCHRSFRREIHSGPRGFAGCFHIVRTAHSHSHYDPGRTHRGNRYIGHCCCHSYSDCCTSGRIPIGKLCDRCRCRIVRGNCGPD